MFKRAALISTILLFNQAAWALSPKPQPENISLSSARRLMTDKLRKSGIKNEAVLAAMERVQRHEFVPKSYEGKSYDNISIPIGKIQTLTQPLMVALMSEAIRPRPTDKVLEIGTGTGYSSAVLGELVKSVYTIEIEPSLAKSAADRLARLGYSNVHVKSGDGFFGWPEEAPFDAIILTCNANEVPPKLTEQLKEGGRLLMPLGKEYSQQTLVVITKVGGVLVSRPLTEVQFVPMLGEIKR